MCYEKAMYHHRQRPGWLVVRRTAGKNGYDVTVLEQNARIGGCLQCFTRRGTKFETGMHFIGSCDEGQVLHRLLRYLERHG